MSELFRVAQDVRDQGKSIVDLPLIGYKFGLAELGEREIHSMAHLLTKGGCFVQRADSLRRWDLRRQPPCLKRDSRSGPDLAVQR